MLPATLALAFSALLRNKMRSLLTMLGIVIGVAAVVMMQSMGRGATAYIGDAISGLGSNMLMVVPGTAKGMQQSSLGVPLFSAGDLDAVRRQAHDVELVSAAGSRPTRAVVGPYNRSVTTFGVTPEYFEIRAWGVVSGRLLNQVDERRAAAVCVIGQTVADALYPGRSPLGQEMRVHQLACRVVGVMEPKGASVFGMDQDDVIFLPYSTFSRRIMGSDRVQMFMASARRPEFVEDAKAQIIRVLHARRHIPEGEDDNFAVRDPREVQALLQRRGAASDEEPEEEHDEGLDDFAASLQRLKVQMVSELRRNMTLESDLAITPYVHPRLSLDFCGGCSGSESQLGISVDVGANFEITRVLALRASAFFGGSDRFGEDGFGLSLAWTPPGLRR